MLCSRPHLRRILCCLPSAALALLAVVCVSVPAPAQGTHLWTQSHLEEFENGVPEGVALTSDGHLLEGPGLAETLTTPSTYVWSVAVDKSGTIYAGTAAPATVLRIGADHKPFKLFESRDIAVQAVRLGPDGALYAATLPSGKVYRIAPDATATQDASKATVVFDAAQPGGAESAAKDAPSTDNKAALQKSHFIWDMTFDSAGRLYIATGGPAAIYRYDPARPGARPELFFKTDEEHIRCLAWDAKGNLIAGTDGSGLVYRISPLGKGYVLFEAPRREITAVTVATDGTIYAACVGDKTRNPLPPLPVQGMGMASITIIQPSSMQAVNSSTSLPEGTAIYALTPGEIGLAQAPRKLWVQKDEIVYQLTARPDGLLALAGNRGHIFRIAVDGSFADIGHLEAQQGLCDAADPAHPGSLVIGTGNTGKLYTLGASTAHEYASDVLDAGALARFGRVEVEPGSSGYQIFTRTGNMDQPVRGRNNWGWDDWQPLDNEKVASPAGRYLQWKAVLLAGGRLGSVGINYLPVNSAPVIDDLVVVPGARVTSQTLASMQSQTINIQFPSSGQSASSYDSGSSTSLQANKDRGAVTVRWAAHDDDGDDLIYSLYLRGDGETVWRLLKDKIADKAYSFDAVLVPDGGYQIKVVASDAPSHTPGQALIGSKFSDRFVIDTTPPAITSLRATAEPASSCQEDRCPQPFSVTFEAEDATTPIAHAEYSLDAGPWQYIDPIGGLSDSKHERYEIHLSLDGQTEHLITVRAYDREDNASAAKTVIPAQKAPARGQSAGQEPGREK